MAGITLQVARRGQPVAAPCVRGTWQVQARKTAAVWCIGAERLERSLRVAMPKAE